MSLKFLKDKVIEQAMLTNQTLVQDVLPEAFHLEATESHLTDCNIKCAKDECADQLKKDLPFEVTLACTRQRCNCYIELDEPIFEQYLGE